MKKPEPKPSLDTMATNTPLNSNTSNSPESSSAELEPSSSAKHELCLPYDEAVKELPPFLQPSDGQEQKDLAMFLSQVNELHKPIVGKLNARFVCNFVDHMLKPPTSVTREPREVNVPEQLQELTENIAFEIAKSVICDFDLHNTIISVLNVLQEVSWEAKVALSLTTFVLTFGDNGLSLCEESKVSLNEIQMFAELKEGYKHHMDDNDNLFVIIFELIQSIFEFEMLPATYMTSTDVKVKIARTLLIVAVYWIIRIIVVASTSHILKLSSRGDKYDNVISTLWKLPSLWSTKLKELHKKDNLKTILSQLQNILKEDVDIKEYNRIKEIIDERYKSDNMKVLNALFPSNEGDLHLLYDCLRKEKVHLDELKGAYVLLYISGVENIAPKVDETKLNEFIDSFDLESNNEVECKLLWMPIVQRTEAIKKFTIKPLLDFCYIFHQKLNRVFEKMFGQQKTLKNWYSVSDSSRISNEVKKLMRDDWKYKGEPMMVVLDPQGNVIHHNAIHMFYTWGFKAFPFTSESNIDMCTDYTSAPFLPIDCALAELFRNWKGNNEHYFYYGGESMEWIRSFTGLVREVARQVGFPIHMVYVGRSHNREVMRSVEQEKLSHCLSDDCYLWLFWKRLHSTIHSALSSRIYIGDSYHRMTVQSLQDLINYDKSNVGWALLKRGVSSYYYDDGVYHGKVVEETLKELIKLWNINEKQKQKPLIKKFVSVFESHYDELHYGKIKPCKCLEFPTDASLETLDCPDCGNQMEKYTSFICYHPPHTHKSTT